MQLALVQDLEKDLENPARPRQQQASSNEAAKKQTGDDV